MGPEPHTPEPVGVADTVATGLEIVIVVAALWATKKTRARRMDPNAVWVAGTATTVVTIFALLSVMGAAPHLIPGTE